MDAAYWIEHLNLTAHPEGGFYRETYRSTGMLKHEGSGWSRNFSTAIYFLLRHQDRSMFHRIRSDELWHFHSGGRLTLYTLTAGGLVTQTLGQEVKLGDSLQVVIPANHWFGAMITDGPYVLASCTVSPGFDFNDFEIASRRDLLIAFPHHSDIIQQLT